MRHDDLPEAAREGGRFELAGCADPWRPTPRRPVSAGLAATATRAIVADVAAAANTPAGLATAVPPGRVALASPSQAWHGVPEAVAATWQAVFDGARPPQLLCLAAPCPACSRPALRRYFALSRLAPCRRAEGDVQGPGQSWEWCAACRACRHRVRAVPSWWRVRPLDLDHARLGRHPGPLDEALRRERRDLPPRLR